MLTNDLYATRPVISIVRAKSVEVGNIIVILFGQRNVTEFSN